MIETFLETVIMFSLLTFIISSGLLLCRSRLRQEPSGARE